MRVSSGKWRGRSLISPQGQNVRPTAGLVKEALMDMLGARLPGSSVLELFCGTGQLGIETLSRGAAACVFADSSPASCALTGKNLALLGQEAEVLLCDWQSAVSSLSARGRRFDIILADPPYSSGLYEALEREIDRCGLLAPGGVLVLEHDKALTPSTLPCYEILRSRSYGRRSLLLLTPNKEA